MAASADPADRADAEAVSVDQAVVVPAAEDAAEQVAEGVAAAARSQAGAT